MSRMKITFPHMGNMYITVKALLEPLGVKVVIPPKTNKATITKGVQTSPEFACLPLKVNMGNFMEAYKEGANTILMAGGIGPCRFGYYAQIQREILGDLGYEFDMVVLEPPEKHIGELFLNIKKVTGQTSWLRIYQALKFAWQKLLLVDTLEKEIFRYRPRVKDFDALEKFYNKGLAAIDAAQSYKELSTVRKSLWRELSSFEVDWEKECLKIALVGEIYVLLDDYINFDIARKLGRMGVEVDRSIFLSEWVNEHLFKGLLPGIKSSNHAHLAARPWIKTFIGGHGQETVGHTVLYSQEGYDGVIQLAPFTCMPEIVAQSILPKVSALHGIPTLSVIVDEHSGEAGLVTRLEAFIDLISRKNYQRREVI